MAWHWPSSSAYSQVRSDPYSLRCYCYCLSFPLNTCSGSGKRVKVNKLVDRSDAIKQDNLLMCKDSWAARFPDWNGPVLPCEGFFLQNEVGLRDAIAFLHFCQLHVAPELVARGHRSRKKAVAPLQCSQGHTMEVSAFAGPGYVTGYRYSLSARGAW